MNWAVKDSRSFPDRTALAMGEAQERGRRNILGREKGGGPATCRDDGGEETAQSRLGDAAAAPDWKAKCRAPSRPDPEKRNWPGDSTKLF